MGRTDKSQNTHDPVYSRFNHHARHDRGNMRGGGGMGFGKPYVKRHNAGLRAEPNEREQKAYIGKARVMKKVKTREI